MPLRKTSYFLLALTCLLLLAGGRRAALNSRPGADPGASRGSVVHTLRTGIADGRMVFIGVGDGIDGVVDPEIVLHEGERAQINLITGEGAEHDIVVELYGVRSNHVIGKEASATVSFIADKTGVFAYYCSLPGHHEAGMQGRLRVEPGPRTGAAPLAPDISRDPSDLPRPVQARGPRTVRVDLATVERKGRLDDNTT